MNYQKSILVIEDDTTYAELLKILLREYGFNVKVAHDGSSLDHMISTARPDLLIIDYNLPGQNGAVLTRQIKQNIKLKDLPVIMVSANHDIRKKAMESGSDDFFAKPISFSKFVSRITELTN